MERGRGKYFYPRSPCGERQCFRHANGKPKRFLSTLSLRRATPTNKTNLQNKIVISIHALLAESDSASRITPTASRNFYPRSPCGERHLGICVIKLIKHFYPRSPCGERQYLVRGQRPNWGISIHALLAESDLIRYLINARYTNFYPRSPCGERPPPAPQGESSKKFLSTLSLRRATHYDNYNLHCVEISIHALLAESDFNQLTRPT